MDTASDATDASVGAAILLTGCRRAGKSAIARVVFDHVPPHDTLFSEPSLAIRVLPLASNPFLSGTTLWDIPGDFEWARPSARRGVARPTGPGRGGNSSQILLPTLQSSICASVWSGEGGGDGSDGGAEETPQIIVKEEALLRAARSIVFVIDGSDEPPYTAAMGTLRSTMVGLLALASLLERAAAERSSSGTSTGGGAPLLLPVLDVFIHKVDSEPGGASSMSSQTQTHAGGGGAAMRRQRGGGGGEFGAEGGAEEARSDLLRSVSEAVFHELGDLGFAVGGRGGDGWGIAGDGGQSTVTTASRSPGGGGGVPLSVSFHVTSVFNYTVYEALSKVVQRVCPGPYLAAPLENLLNAVLQQGAGPRCVFDKAFLFDTPTKLVIASDSNPAQEGTYQLCADALEIIADIGGIYDPLQAAAAGGGEDEQQQQQGQQLSAPSPYLSLIRLSNGLSLYCSEVAPSLALVCLLRDEEAALAVAAAAAAGMVPMRGIEGAPPPSPPRCALSFPQQGLLDHNLRTTARAIARLFAHAEGPHWSDASKVR